MAIRRTAAFSAFVAVGAGTWGVGALTIPKMVGADGLRGLVEALIEECQDTGECLSIASGQLVLMSYIGTGSGNGQVALLNGSQSIAPMSRPLGTGICETTARATAEGIVFGLGAISVMGSAGNACAAGVQHSGQPGVVTNDWRHVLRLIYAGMPTGQNNIHQRDCNSASRRSLLNDWDAIFRDACTGKPCNTDSHPSSGTAASPPAQRYDVNNVIVEPGLRHAFRRDEESGVTDIFLAMLQLPNISFVQNGPEGTSPSLTPAQQNAFRALAHSPFCSVRRPTDSHAPVTVAMAGAFPASVIPETVDLGTVPAPAGGGSFGGWDHDGNPATPVRWRVLVTDRMFPEFQDQDPVRRFCVGINTTAAVLPNEQVCGADGKLGVVLPISPPPFSTTAEVFPTVPCATGDHEFGPALARPNGQSLRCPNGDEAVGSPGSCRLPRALDGSFDCLNRGGSWGPAPAAPWCSHPAALLRSEMAKHLARPSFGPTSTAERTTSSCGMRQAIRASSAGQTRPLPRTPSFSPRSWARSTASTRRARSWHHRAPERAKRSMRPSRSGASSMRARAASATARRPAWRSTPVPPACS